MRNVLLFWLSIALALTACLPVHADQAVPFDKALEYDTPYNAVKVFQREETFQDCFFMGNGAWRDCASKREVSREKVAAAVTRSYEFVIAAPGQLAIYSVARTDHWFYQRASVALWRWDEPQQKWTEVRGGQHYLSYHKGKVIDSGPLKGLQHFPSLPVADNRYYRNIVVPDDRTISVPAGRYRVDLSSARRFGPVEQVYVPSEIRTLMLLYPDPALMAHPGGNGKTPLVVAWSGEFVEVGHKDAWTDLADFTSGRTAIGVPCHQSVVTGLESSALLYFPGLGFVHVGPMSEFSVSDYLVLRHGVTAKTDLKVGELEVKVDERLKEVDFSVTTPTCTVSVRGTAFSVEHRDNPVRTLVRVTRGVVRVRPKAGGQAPLTLTAGQQAMVTPQGATLGGTAATGLPEPSDAPTATVAPIPTAKGPLFRDDFSHGTQQWHMNGITPQLRDGRLFWNDPRHRPISTRTDIPLEDVVIEYDARCDGDGLAVRWFNRDKQGYLVVPGSWRNTRSASGFGFWDRNTQYVMGRHIRFKTWQHYKIVRFGGKLEVYVDGRRIISRDIPERIAGSGPLRFYSYADVAIDNVTVRRAHARNALAEPAAPAGAPGN